MQQHGIDLIDTRFSYSVKYRGGVYAHDFDSDIRRELQPEIRKFQNLLKRLHWFGRVNNTRSRAAQSAEPVQLRQHGNGAQLGPVFGRLPLQDPQAHVRQFPDGDERVRHARVAVLALPAVLRHRGRDADEDLGPGHARIYEALSGDFRDRIYLERPVRKVYRRPSHVLVEEENGNAEKFDDVVFACNANQTLMMLHDPTYLESSILSSIRYESELHNHTIVHSDASVLPDSDVEALDTRSNHIEQYGTRPDNYEITYIMHNQQPWAKGSDKPCLVTYNAISPIDESKIIKKWWFQHVVHDVRHIALLIQLFRFIQGKRRSWHCGAHTLINSQETCFVTGPHRGQAARCGLSVRRPRSEKVVQLLRAHAVRLAVQESLKKA